MNCTRTAPKTHWTNVGYNAAKHGLAFEAVRVPGDDKVVNQWISGGMAKWQRKALRQARDLASALRSCGI